MAVHSLRCGNAAVRLFLASLTYIQYALAITGSVYQLDSEYLGANFFQGWDFYTGGDPTGGFVTYYSQGSAQLKGMINASDTSPVYIGSDYTTVIGSTQAAGRPSVRISTQRSWTHGLFIGDFNHAPSGYCGTWPAFWTLGSNWPNNGEIDIMEGANQVMYNAATLHSSTVCTIAGDSRTMTGSLTNNDCAYYPGYNVGCGVKDNRTTSYGSGFNALGGGVYAMQWTSDYIRVWFFPRGAIPSDITNKAPNPASWGLPSANLQGSCVIDQHFQGHKLILNNAFCGEYAGAASVWNSTTSPSCAISTGYATCNAYVAAVPAAFQNAYWSINSIRVYQLADSNNSTNTSVPYIASSQPTQSTVAATPSSSTPVPTTSLCPTYNFTVVQSGNYNYEIECGVNIGGSDLGKPYPSYTYSNFEGCVAGCSYWNTNNASNICGGVTYIVSSNACYWKRNVGSSPAQAGYNSARLIYYAYPQVTDDPRTQTTSSTTSYVSTSVTPAYYAPANVTTTTSFALITESPTANVTEGGALGGGATSDGGSSSITDSGTSTSRSYTGSYSRRSDSASSTDSMLVSSTSGMLFISATMAMATSLSAPPSSSPTTTTALLPASTTSSAQLSLRSLTQSTLSVSTPLAMLSTSASTSNLGSTSNLASSSAEVVVQSTSSGAPIFTSPVVSQVQMASSISSRPTSGYLSLSINHTPSSGSSPAAPSSLAHSSSSLISSFMSASPLSSTAKAGPAISNPTTVQLPPQTSEISIISSPVASSAQELPATSFSPVLSSTTTAALSNDPSNVLTTSPTSASTIALVTSSEPYTTTVMDVLPGPTEITTPNGASFALAGCLGPRPNTQFANSFTLVEDSPVMSIERCISDCSLDVYAGLYDTQCYCSTYSLPTDASEDFIEYPASACNTTCPGDPTQKCGGKVSSTDSSPSRLGKRQIMDTNGNLFLFTLYNNTARDVDISSSTGGMIMTTSASSGVISGGSEGVIITSVSMSMAGGSSMPPLSLVTTSTPLAQSSASASGSQTDNPILNTASTTSWVVSDSNNTPLPTSNPSLQTSQSLFPTLVSTTYTTLCSFHAVICPTRTETCLTTTITVLHCGCAETPVPEVPMTTTTVEGCAITPPPPSPGGNNNMGGQEQAENDNTGQVDEENNVSMTTLTIPCTESISSLEAAVTAWSASAAAVANAQAHATATVTATDEGGNTHAPVPYTFPISFPMASSPAASSPAAAGTVTKNLVFATAPYNFSVPAVQAPSTAAGVNGTWYGEVMNVTVAPVALSAMGSASAMAGSSAVASAGAGVGKKVKSGASLASGRSGAYGVGGMVLSILCVWLVCL